LARLNHQLTTAPVGLSVHRMMVYVLFIWFLTLHCTTVNLFWLLALTFFFWPFLFQPWPPFYPPTSIELHRSPNKQSPYSPCLPTFYLVLAKPLPLKKNLCLFLPKFFCFPWQNFYLSAKKKEKKKKKNLNFLTRYLYFFIKLLPFDKTSTSTEPKPI
jgi:hypothetical protein